MISESKQCYVIQSVSYISHTINLVTIKKPWEAFKFLYKNDDTSRFKIENMGEENHST